MSQFFKGLARFSEKTFTHGAPQSVQTKIKEIILDQLGIQIGSADHPRNQAIRDYQSLFPRRGHSLILHFGDRTSPETAAFTNSFFGNGTSFNDSYGETPVYPGAVIVPAAFAVAEDVRATGMKTFRAVAAGLEVTLKVARSHESLKTAAASVGSAVTSGLLLGLTENQLLHAISIAANFCQSPAGVYSSRAKGLQTAIPAAAGVRAAYFARAGMSSGFKREEGEITQTSEKDFLIESIELKKHNCSDYIHPALELTISTVGEIGLCPSEVQSIDVGLSAEGIAQAGKIRFPSDELNAQSSAAYVIALGLLEGNPGIESYTRETLHNPEILEFVQKIRVFEDGTCTKEHPQSKGAVITIKTSDGREITQRKKHARGTKQNPMSPVEITGKFIRNLISAGYSAEETEIIMNGIEKIENYDLISELTQKLVSRPFADISIGSLRTAEKYFHQNRPQQDRQLTPLI